MFRRALTWLLVFALLCGAGAAVLYAAGIFGEPHGHRHRFEFIVALILFSLAFRLLGTLEGPGDVPLDPPAGGRDPDGEDPADDARR